jgi:Predicted xylanase/chitin deacetylase
VIVKRVLDNTRDHSIILLHDGGGDRSQTVAALPEILRTLKSRGYKFYRMWCR